MRKWIEIIHTERSRNCAYIAYQESDPYYATNMDANLDKVEAIIGCKFNDGHHPFVRFDIKDLDEVL